jgi:hypothetical protein
MDLQNLSSASSQAIVCRQQATGARRWSSVVADEDSFGGWSPTGRRGKSVSSYVCFGIKIKTQIISCFFANYNKLLLA